jgi:hypothetical protein
VSYGPTVYVKGLAELNKAFAKLGSEVKRELVLVLTKAAAPVAATAAQNAWGEIRNMTERWSKMRVGATANLVYVAPGARRNRGTARPNLGTLLMTRAMEPALDTHAAEIEAAVEAAIDELTAENGF